jgi:uncharacterized flavoprotein (TIGR03862 family)
MALPSSEDKKKKYFKFLPNLPAMKKTVAIIGSGPSALMLAAELDEHSFDVTIYERNPSPGRKFLVAGNGGFNLTHAEPLDQFVKKYTPFGFLDETISSFSNTDLKNWLAAIGIPTYIGSSNRVFPEKNIKPKEVLHAFLKIISKKGAALKTKYLWNGWNNNHLLFQHNSEIKYIAADITVFAMGGGSWKKTGSDGSWTSHFANKGIDVIPLQPSNCAFQIQWEKTFAGQAEGKSLKNISLKCAGKEKKGEVVITNFGLEGGAIYALSPEIRKQINEDKKAILFLDLKPALTLAEIIERLQTNKKKLSWTKHVENQLKFSKVQLSLLKTILSKDDFLDPVTIADKIKNLPLIIISMAPIDEAISTAGGIALYEIDKNYQLNKIPDQYAIGEMLDWDAPTGGYLLQACFSMGKQLADHLNQRYKEQSLYDQ